MITTAARPAFAWAGSRRGICDRGDKVRYLAMGKV
jgi:hypothetical protein